MQKQLVIKMKQKPIANVTTVKINKITNSMQITNYKNMLRKVTAKVTWKANENHECDV